MTGARDITAQLREIARSNSIIAKQIETTSKSLGDVSKVIRRASALENVSMLSGKELEALKEVANAGSDPNTYCQQRIHENADRPGTDLALADAGFLNAVEDFGQGVYVFSITNRGLWAIEHQSVIDKEQKAEKQRETIKFFLGVAVELIAVILAWWLGANGPSLITP